MTKFRGYTDEALAYAKLDCYETLEAGQYGTDHTYGRKLWAEIDAIRDEQMVRRKRNTTSQPVLWHTRSNGQPLDTEA